MSTVNYINKILVKGIVEKEIELKQEANCLLAFFTIGYSENDSIRSNQDIPQHHDIVVGESLIKKAFELVKMGRIILVEGKLRYYSSKQGPTQIKQARIEALDFYLQ